MGLSFWNGDMISLMERPYHISTDSILFSEFKHWYLSSQNTFKRMHRPCHVNFLLSVFVAAGFFSRNLLAFTHPDTCGSTGVEMPRILVLFDVDGTLTAARQLIKPEMTQTLSKLR